MIKGNQPGNAFDSFRDAELQRVLDAQRAAIESAFGLPKTVPAVGDIWMSSARWTIGPEDGLAAMLVVLRAFTETWSTAPLFDVAPVSEDDRLASEWSLVFSATDSGLGLPLVLHVDVQSTTTSSMLIRRVGPLADAARMDLLDLLRAYAMGDSTSFELRVGRLGRLNIRFHPEWEDFVKQLIALSKDFSASLPSDRNDAGDNTANETSHLGEGWLAIVAGSEPYPLEVREGCKWEYRNVPPFVYCHASAKKGTPVRLLGDAIALYYSQYSRANNICRSAPRQIDAETFHRLEPLLNEPLAPLLKERDSSLAIRKLAGEFGINPSDISRIAILVESVRCAKTTSGFTVGVEPTRLAARRPKTD